MKTIAFVLAAAALAAGPLAAAAADPPAWKWYEVKDGKVQVYLHVFWSTTCPHCAKAHVFLGELQKRHVWLKILTYEITGHAGNRAFYQQMAAALGKQAGQVPAFFYCNQMEVGFVSDETSGRRLEAGLVRCRDALQKQLDDRRKPAPRWPPSSS